MKRILILLSLIFPLAATAQMVAVRPGTDDPGELVFNETFIARNRVKAVVGQRLVKRDNQPMYPQKEKHLYRFDTQGRTTYANHSYGQPGSGRDTTSMMVTYDENGLVKQRMRNDLSGHFALNIERDAEGRAVRQTYTRIANLGTDRYALQPGEVTAISDEHYRHEVINDSCWRQVFLNELGLPYREQVHRKDRLGYLRSIEDRYLISNRTSRITFRYDEQGRLAERTEQPDLQRPKTTRRTWTYDQAGNVISGTLWHDDVQMDQDEYLYEEQSMLLKARLTRNIASGIIHVVRYTTEHY